MTERLRLGELLVDMKLISRDQLEVALSEQSGDSRRLGEILVDQGLVSEAQVTQVLSQQLSVPWVSLQHIDFSRQLLNLVPRETAELYGVVPIYVRRARNRKETLYVAMKDPTDDGPLKEIEQHTGLPVRSMIAPPTDIRAAIRAYYLGLPPEEELEAEPVSLPHPPMQIATHAPTASAASAAPMAPSSAAASPPQSADAATLPEQPEAEAPPPVLDDDDDDEPKSGRLHARDTDMPKPKPAVGPKMVTLTMLDGMEITLPAKSARSKKSGEGSDAPAELTARDLVDALRAQAAGADASEVLGEDVNWERMFAALLSLLLKKHLIHDWEFVNELHRE